MNGFEQQMTFVSGHRPVHRVARPIALLAVALVVVACSPTPTPSPAPPSSAAIDGTSAPTASVIATPASSESPSAQPGLLLTEVLFAPVPGDPPFVEISNAGPAAVDVAGTKLRLGAKELGLGSSAQPLAPGAQLLVLFDGLGTTEPANVHAPAAFTLPSDTGSVTLLDQLGKPLDRVAWGAGQPDGVRLTPGALTPSALPSGTSIGRPPGVIHPSQPADWALYSPNEVSPGRPNAMSPVGVLLPLSGSVVEGTHATLAWYPVAGAASYRMQVASDRGFGTILVDQTVQGPQADTGPLAPGDYVWRVAALATDGTTSSFSDPSDIALEGATAVAFAAADDPGRRLSVPLLAQHKDTSMLLMEDPVETGPRAWDNDHVTFSPTDRADNQNCALASIAMVNHFFGGDLSQDRIGYEIYAELLRPRSPERDLNYGYGIYPDHVTKALAFALGGTPIHLTPGMSADDIWATIKTSIDAGRPVLAAGTSHVFVFTGYSVHLGKRLLSTNDPWHYAGGPSGTGQFNIDAASGKDAPGLLDLWLMPANAVGRHQEPSVKTDSDGDGVVDFDETERFHTNPNEPDSDHDGVHDKQDIVSGIFEPTYGYARDPDNSAGRDFDTDGLATELDPDSDAGGCMDGAEDKDGNGHRNGNETWNFDASDDACHDLVGTITYDRTSSIDTGVGTTARLTGLETLHVTIQVAMLTDPDDPTQLIDAGSTYTVDRVVTFDREVGGDCNPEESISRSKGTYRFSDPPVPSAGHTSGELGGDPGAGPRIWGYVDRERGLMSINMSAWYPETTEAKCQLFILPTLPDVIDLWGCGNAFSGLYLGVDATIKDQPAGPYPVVVDCTQERPALNWDKQKIVANGQLTLISN